MSILKSDPVTVNKPPKEVYDFLSDFRNFSKLMPPQVEDWKATSEECSFSVKGMASLGLKYVNKVPNSLLEIEGTGRIPVGFTLHCHIEGNQKSTVRLEFEAALNPMMKMLAERPLTNFMNMLGEKLQDLFSGKAA